MAAQHLATRISFRAAIIVFGIAWLGIGASATERQTIPFSINDDGHMMVDVTVNELIETEAVLDTAATHAMIDGTVAGRASVPAPDGKQVNVLGLTGAEFFPVVNVDRFQFGTVSQLSVPSALNNRPAAASSRSVLPTANVRGDVLDFDFVEESLSIYDGRPERSRKLDTTNTAMEEIDGLWFARVHINGKRGLALIDTGSSLTFINSAFADAASAVTHMEKTQKLQGATGGGIGVRISTVRSFNVGKRRVSNFDLLVADPQLFAHLGLQDEPAMVLGLDYLSVFRVQMDRRRGRLILGTRKDPRRGFGISTNVRGTNIPQD